MKKKLLLILLVLIMVVCGFVACELYISKYGLKSTYYTMKSEQLTNSFRIVQLTDLHDSEFGKDNQKLIKAVSDENPDTILITGDLVNSKNSEDTSIATNVITELVKIAPVYVSYGNQEDSLERQYGVNIISLYEEAGATVLERDYIDVNINGQNICLGGIYGYCQSYVNAQETHREEESEFMKKFQNTDNYSILMCHMPYAWIEEESLYDWNVDCVLSGHVHGGQIRIPFIGGVWAPDHGWFPGDECGVYTTVEENWVKHRENCLKWGKQQKYDVSYYEKKQGYEESNLILSRGLGNTDNIPRFNNIPEIVVTDFVSSN